MGPDSGAQRFCFTCLRPHDLAAFKDGVWVCRAPAGRAPRVNTAAASEQRHAAAPLSEADFAHLHDAVRLALQPCAPATACLKLSDATPADLPRSLRASILASGLFGARPPPAMTGAVLPGCTLLVLDALAGGEEGQGDAPSGAVVVLNNLLSSTCASFLRAQAQVTVTDAHGRTAVARHGRVVASTGATPRGDTQPLPPLSIVALLSGAACDPVRAASGEPLRTPIRARLAGQWLAVRCIADGGVCLPPLPPTLEGCILLDAADGPLRQPRPLLLSRSAAIVAEVAASERRLPPNDAQARSKLEAAVTAVGGALNSRASARLMALGASHALAQRWPTAAQRLMSALAAAPDADAASRASCHGFSLLHTAAATHDAGLVEIVLRCGGEAALFGSAGVAGDAPMKLTPLHLAAASGDAATTAALLRCDLPGCCEAVLAWTTVLDSAGRTPSFVVASSGAASLLELNASVCRLAASAAALAASARQAVAADGGIVSDEHECALAESLLQPLAASEAASDAAAARTVAALPGLHRVAAAVARAQGEAAFASEVSWTAAARAASAHFAAVFGAALLLLGLSLAAKSRGTPLTSSELASATSRGLTHAEATRLYSTGGAAAPSWVPFAACGATLLAATAVPPVRRLWPRIAQPLVATVWAACFLLRPALVERAVRCAAAAPLGLPLPHPTAASLLAATGVSALAPLRAAPLSVLLLLQTAMVSAPPDLRLYPVFGTPTAAWCPPIGAMHALATLAAVYCVFASEKRVRLRPRFPAARFRCAHSRCVIFPPQAFHAHFRTPPNEVPSHAASLAEWWARRGAPLVASSLAPLFSAAKADSRAASSTFAAAAAGAAAVAAVAIAACERVGRVAPEYRAFCADPSAASSPARLAAMSACIGLVAFLLWVKHARSRFTPEELASFDGADMSTADQDRAYLGEKSFATLWVGMLPVLLDASPRCDIRAFYAAHRNAIVFAVGAVRYVGVFVNLAMALPRRYGLGPIAIDCSFRWLALTYLSTLVLVLLPCRAPHKAALIVLRGALPWLPPRLHAWPHFKPCDQGLSAEARASAVAAVALLLCVGMEHRAFTAWKAGRVAARTAALRKHQE